MQLAQIQAIRAQHDKSATEHQISFINTFNVVDQQRASLCEQELERSKVELSAVYNQVDNKKHEIERSKSELQQQLDHLQALKKELDDELMIRIVLEIELQTFREELIFMRAIYEEECNDLALLGTFQIDVGQFYRDELARAVANIKKDFETISHAQYQEWEVYYKTKTEEVQKEVIEQTLKKTEASRSSDVGIMDMKTIKLALDESRNSYTALQTENSSLANRMRELEEEFERIRFRGFQSKTTLEQEFAMLLAEFNGLKAAISNIHENNISLQFEINTYRRLLEGVSPATVTKTREITLIWSNSSTADFSAIDSKASFVLQWAESVKVTAAMISLPTTFIGPKGCTGVSFSAVFYTSHERIIIDANIGDQFNFYNYGQYQLTILYPNSKTVIGTWAIHIEPKGEICMPKQYIIRDSINNFIADTTVQLLLNGQVVFAGVSDDVGVVNLPRNLSDNCYDVVINTHKAQYKTAKFQRIVFQDRGVESVTYFIYRQMQSDEVEFLLTWGKRPSDLDSHVEGGGPETIKVKLEPNMKYVYAVHRYSKDGELPKSDATVTISTNENADSDYPFTVVRVPYANQPDANFWV
ncbi:unnamed protein product, partial [Rotaria sp. Silwood2]